MSDTTIASFYKDERSELRISWTTFKNRLYLDIRLYYLTREGTWLPSPKGVTLNPKLIPGLATVFSELALYDSTIQDGHN